MKTLALLALSVMAAAPWSSRGLLDEPTTPGPFVITRGVKVETLRDQRRIAMVNRSGGILGVFDPLFEGDGGREGVIVSIRVATALEAQNFPKLKGGDYLVLTYSSGDVLVLTVRSYGGVQPRRCDDNGPEIVSRNIACKLDLEQAEEDFDDRMRVKSLVTGPEPDSYPPLEDYRVPKSELVLHFGADHRTVWVTDGAGRELWRGDPFEMAEMKPYRLFRPLIVAVGGACGSKDKPQVALRYDSTQFGCLDARTGGFEFYGQD